MAAPFHELTKEGIDWHWNPEHEAAFQNLKEALASQPFVALANDHDPFVLRREASDTCLGGALLQRTATGEKVIAYISRKFSTTEQKWSTWEGTVRTSKLHQTIRLPFRLFGPPGDFHKRSQTTVILADSRHGQ